MIATITPPGKSGGLRRLRLILRSTLAPDGPINHQCFVHLRSIFVRRPIKRFTDTRLLRTLVPPKGRLQQLVRPYAIVHLGYPAPTARIEINASNTLSIGRWTIVFCAMITFCSTPFQMPIARIRTPTNIRLVRTLNSPYLRTATTFRS